MPIEIKYAPAVEPGTYPAVVTDVETRTSQKTGGEYRRWEFSLEDGRTLSALTGMSVGPRSRAGQWIATLIGRTPELGESIEVVGLPCLIGVTIDEEGFSQVTSLLARERKASPVKPSTPADKAAEQHAIQENDPLPF